MSATYALDQNIVPLVRSEPPLSAKKRAYRKWFIDQEAANDAFYLMDKCTQGQPIHMNGRVFDPEIARFLSADPFIQAPSNLQSYNRYSYVLNNPLRYTDPSGFFFKKLKRAVSSFWKKNRRGFFRSMFGIFGHSQTVRNVINAGACIMVPVSCGAVTAANTYAGGASTSDALKAGARGQIGAWIGQGISDYSGGTLSNWNVPGAQHIGNGIGGGVQSSINGGEFKDGFVGGFAGSYGAGLNIPGLDPRLTAGFVGGTASYLGGGKYGWGFFTGAFAAQWNHCQHGLACSLPTLPEGFVDFSAGLGDALLLGYGDELRSYFGKNGGVNQSSTAYTVGEGTAMAAGGARLVYAGGAKLGSALATDGAMALTIRNQLKTIFRGGLFKNYRSMDYTKAWNKYGSDAIIQQRAGVTNYPINTYGAGLLVQPGGQ